MFAMACHLVVFVITTMMLYHGQVCATNNSTVLLSPSSTIAPTQSTSTSPLNQSVPSTTLPVTNQSSSSLNQSSVAISITPTSTTVQPSPSQSVHGDSAQVDVGDSGGGGKSVEVALPPDSERRDFELIANTEMKWINYLLDKKGDEYIYIKKYVQDVFNKLLKDLPGFVKTEFTDIFEEKVTFILVIYTKKEFKVTESQLKSFMTTYLKSGKDTLKIYAYEIRPRFQEMAAGGNIKEGNGPPQPPAADPVNGFMAFITGFGCMLGMIMVCTAIGIAKYKITQKLKSEDDQDKELLQKQ